MSKSPVTSFDDGTFVADLKNRIATALLAATRGRALLRI